MTSVREHNSSIRTNSIHRWLIGYVARFIFETAKISQLFCHQILWNMKANCYKDDAGEVVCIRNSGVWWQCLTIDLILDKHRRTLWNQPWIEWSICSLTLFPEKRRNSTRKSLDSSMKSLQFRANWSLLSRRPNQRRRFVWSLDTDDLVAKFLIGKNWRRDG